MLIITKKGSQIKKQKKQKRNVILFKCEKSGAKAARLFIFVHPKEHRLYSGLMESAFIL